MLLSTWDVVGSKAGRPGHYGSSSVTCNASILDRPLAIRAQSESPFEECLAQDCWVSLAGLHGLPTWRWQEMAPRMVDHEQKPWWKNVRTDCHKDAVSRTTFAPNGAQLVAGVYTVSVSVADSKQVELDVEERFDEFVTIPLKGPTNFVSVVRWRSVADAEDASASALLASARGTAATMSLSSKASNLTRLTTSNSSSIPSRSKPASVRASVASGASASKNSTKPSVTLHVDCADPDCYMAAAYNYAYTKTTHPPPLAVPTDRLEEACALWDPKCKTNLTEEALFNNFFNGVMNSTVQQLKDDPCFVDLGYNETTCHGKPIDPKNASLSIAAKSYLRSPQCSSDYNSLWLKYSKFTKPLTSTLTNMIGHNYIKWNNDNRYQETYPPGLLTLTHDPIQPEKTDCGCGQCNLYGPNVDVFYWPEPGSDGSCLSIVGTEVKPLLEGVKTAKNGDLFWGTVTNSYDIYVGTQTTAVLMTINGITIKQRVVNPWANDGEGTDMPAFTTTRPLDTTKSQGKSSTITPPPAALRAKPKLIKRFGLPMNGSSGGSVAVVDGHTFISPSIYIAFTSLWATDQCGWLGSVIPVTTMAFAPEDVSTVEGRILAPAFDKPFKFSTKRFNFADLPCPPRSVMEADWYKPAPGEPYRPLIAMPSALRSLQPQWQNCHDPDFFTGLDPPRALIATGFMNDPAQHGPDVQQASTLDNQANFHSEATMLAPPEQTPGPAAQPASKPESPAPEPTQNRKPTNDGDKDPHDPSIPDPAVNLEPSKASADPKGINTNIMDQLHNALSLSSSAPAVPPSPQAQPQPQASQGPASKNPQQGPAQQQGQQKPKSDPQNVPQNDPSQQNAANANKDPPKPAVSVSDPKSVASADSSKDGAAPGPVPQPQAHNVVIGGNTFGVPQVPTATNPSVNGQPIVPLSDGKHQVGSQILQPGGPAVAVGESTVQINPQGSPVINGAVVQPQPTVATATADGHVIINDGGGGVQVDGVHLPTGTGPPRLVGGTPAWVPQNTPAGIATQQPGIQLPPSVPTPVITLPGGQAVNNVNGAYRINDQSLQQGGPPVVVSGSSYSLDSSNSIHVNGEAFHLPSMATPSSTNVAGQVVVPLPSGIAIGGETLHPGDAPITLSNSVSVSLGSSVLLVGSNTIAVNAAVSPSQPTIQAGGNVLTQAPGGSGYRVGGSTLLPGSPAVTIGGTPYSLAPPQSALIVGTSTIPLATYPSDSQQDQQGHSPLVANGQTFTPLNPSTAVISSTSLAVGGPALTIGNGQTASLATNGLVVGSSTYAFPTPAPSSGPGASTTRASTSPEAYQGGAASSKGALFEGVRIPFLCGSLLIYIYGLF